MDSSFLVYKLVNNKDTVHLAWVQGDVCKVPAVCAFPPLLVSLWRQAGAAAV